jgi:hypothetical protein
VGFLKALLKLIRHPHDEELRFAVVRRVARTFVPAYRFKWWHMGWWQDDTFNAYLTGVREIDGLNTDRRWMMYQLMRLVDAVPGDTAECGVFEGAGSYLMCRVNAENSRHDRTHYAFDSFEGLSSPSGEDGDYWNEGNLACGLDHVKAQLAEFESVVYCEGWIPTKFSDAEDRTFAFVHVDVDLHEPTRDSIEFFYPRMNPGGIILCDDYGLTTCPGATKAIDEFLADKPEKMLALCSGGGFFVKGCQTAPLLGESVPHRRTAARP